MLIAPPFKGNDPEPWLCPLSLDLNQNPVKVLVGNAHFPLALRIS